MLQDETYPHFNAEYYNQEKFLDVVTKKKINKHLSDINDKITDEDIKNVKTDIGINGLPFNDSPQDKQHNNLHPLDVIKSPLLQGNAV